MQPGFRQSSSFPPFPFWSPVYGSRGAVIWCGAALAKTSLTLSLTRQQAGSRRTEFVCEEKFSSVRREALRLVTELTSSSHACASPEVFQ
jgi:hypothetical protein